MNDGEANNKNGLTSGHELISRHGLGVFMERSGWVVIGHSELSYES